MKNNYVAKYAREFNTCEVHRDRTKYTRGAKLTKLEALDELADDLELEWELERKRELELELEFEPEDSSYDYIF